MTDRAQTFHEHGARTRADATAHARENVRLWRAGEQTNPWPAADALLAHHFLRLQKEAAEMRREIRYLRSLTPVSLGGQRV